MRFVTLITDFGEALLFVESNHLEWGARFVIELLPFTPHPWLKRGLKLALIAPNMYLLKLFFCNTFIIPAFGVPQLEPRKIFLAYGISLSLSFTMGVMYDLFLEKLLEAFVRRVSQLMNRRPNING